MSSKWNKGQSLQPPPKICRKQPEGWKYTDFLFPVYPLQAYVYWVDPHSPLDGSVAGQTTLDPFEVWEIHYGVIEGDPHRIEIDLIYTEATGWFSLVIQLYQGTFQLGSVEKHWQEPPPDIPWETRLFVWDDPASSFYVECRIFS